MRKLKKLLPVLAIISAVLTAAFIGMPVKAAGDVQINGTNFPDEKFRNYISSHFDNDGNKVLSSAEISAVKNIDCSYYGVSDLKGIEYFTALTYLNCNCNQITSLDLSKNTSLMYVYCDINHLTKLNVSKCSNLYYLYCSGNQLTSLNVSNNRNLIELTADSNQLTALNVSNNTNLNLLTCSKNKIKTLDLTANTNLEKAYLSENNLTSLVVGKNSSLKFFECNNNKLTQLDVTGCPQLLYLNCGYNSLTTLNLSKNAELQELCCRWNKITSLDFSKCPELDGIECSGNALKKLDVTMLADLYYLDCSDNRLTSLDVRSNPILHELGCARNALTSLTVNKNPWLTYLYCAGNDISSLNISKNTGLLVFDCSDTKISTLDVSNSPNLSSLLCSGTPLTSLNIEKNPNLCTVYQAGKKETSGSVVTYTLKNTSENEFKLVVNKSLKIKAANEKAPLELTFVEPENGVLQITWNKVAGAHRYFVMKKDADGNWKEKIHVTDPGYIDYSPVPGDPNTYTVIAVDIDGKEISGYGKGKTYTYIKPMLTNFSVESKASGVLLSWHQAAYATKYMIYRKPEGGSWEKIATTTSLKYSDKKAVYSETYSYSIRPVTENGNFINERGTGKKITYLVSEPKLTLTNTPDGIQISWKKMTNAAKYRVYVLDPGSDKWTRIAIVTGTTYDDNRYTLMNGRYYRYSVVGLDAGGHVMNKNGNGYGTYRISKVVGFTMENTLNGVKIIPESLAGLAKLRIYRKNASGKWSKIGTIDAKAGFYLDAEATVNADNIYSILGVDESGNVVTEHGSGRVINFGIPTTPVVATAKSSGVRLDWQPVCQAAKYNVYRKTKSTDWTKLGSTSGLAYTDKSAESGKTYFYTVVAVNAAGKTLNAKGEGVKIKFASAATSSFEPKNIFIDEELLEDGIVVDEPVEEIIEEDEIIEDEPEVTEEDSEVVEEESEDGSEDEIVEDDSEEGSEEDEVIEDGSEEGSEDEIIEDGSEEVEEYIEEEDISESTEDAVIEVHSEDVTGIEEIVA